MQLARGPKLHRQPRRQRVPRFSRFSGVKRNYIIVKRLGVGAAPNPAKGSPPADAAAAGTRSPQWRRAYLVAAPLTTTRILW